MLVPPDAGQSPLHLPDVTSLLDMCQPSTLSPALVAVRATLRELSTTAPYSPEHWGDEEPIDVDADFRAELAEFDAFVQAFTEHEEAERYYYRNIGGYCIDCGTPLVSFEAELCFTCVRDWVLFVR